MAAHLQGFFTIMYYFHEESIEFSESVTVWSMFYLKKNLSDPHEKIGEYINDFFEKSSGKKIIAYRYLKALSDRGLKAIRGRPGGTRRK